MSWKPEMKVINDDKWYPNALVFETKAEAELYAKDLFNRWLISTDHRTVESDLPPNYAYVNGELVYIGPKQEEEEKYSGD